MSSSPRVPWTDPTDTRRRTASGWKVWQQAFDEAIREYRRLQRNEAIAVRRSLVKAERDAYHMEQLRSDAKREAKLSRANAKRARKAQRRLAQ